MPLTLRHLRQVSRRAAYLCLFCSLPLMPTLLQGCANAPSAQASIEASATEQKIDALIKVSRARLLLAKDVAQVKWNTQAEITDTAREEQVIAAFVTQATKAGVDATLAKNYISNQITASKMVQSDLHQQWKKQGQGKFTPVVDLAKDVRPQLDALVPQMIAALLPLQNELKQAGFAEQILRRIKLLPIEPQITVNLMVALVDLSN